MKGGGGGGDLKCEGNVQACNNVLLLDSQIAIHVTRINAHIFVWLEVEARHSVLVPST